MDISNPYHFDGDTFYPAQEITYIPNILPFSPLLPCNIQAHPTIVLVTTQPPQKSSKDYTWIIATLRCFNLMNQIDHKNITWRANMLWLDTNIQVKEISLCLIRYYAAIAIGGLKNLWLSLGPLTQKGIWPPST